MWNNVLHTLACLCPMLFIYVVLVNSDAAVELLCPHQGKTTATHPYNGTNDISMY